MVDPNSDANHWNPLFKPSRMDLENTRSAEAAHMQHSETNNRDNLEEALKPEGPVVDSSSDNKSATEASSSTSAAATSSIVGSTISQSQESTAEELHTANDLDENPFEMTDEKDTSWLATADNGSISPEEPPVHDNSGDIARYSTNVNDENEHNDMFGGSDGEASFLAEPEGIDRTGTIPVSTSNSDEQVLHVTAPQDTASGQEPDDGITFNDDNQASFFELQQPANLEASRPTSNRQAQQGHNRMPSAFATSNDDFFSNLGAQSSPIKAQESVAETMEEHMFGKSDETFDLGNSREEQEDVEKNPPEQDNPSANQDESFDLGGGQNSLDPASEKALSNDPPVPSELFGADGDKSFDIGLPNQPEQLESSEHKEQAGQIEQHKDNNPASTTSESFGSNKGDETQNDLFGNSNETFDIGNNTSATETKAAAPKTENFAFLEEDDDLLLSDEEDDESEQKGGETTSGSTTTTTKQPDPTASYFPQQPGAPQPATQQQPVVPPQPVANRYAPAQAASQPHAAYSAPHAPHQQVKHTPVLQQTGSFGGPPQQMLNSPYSPYQAARQPQGQSKPELKPAKSFMNDTRSGSAYDPPMDLVPKKQQQVRRVQSFQQQPVYSQYGASPYAPPPAQQQQQAPPPAGQQKPFYEELPLPPRQQVAPRPSMDQMSSYGSLNQQRRTSGTGVGGVYSARPAPPVATTPTTPYGPPPQTNHSSVPPVKNPYEPVAQPQAPSTVQPPASSSHRYSHSRNSSGGSMKYSPQMPYNQVHQSHSVNNFNSPPMAQFQQQSQYAPATNAYAPVQRSPVMSHVNQFGASGASPATANTPPVGAAAQSPNYSPQQLAGNSNYTPSNYGPQSNYSPRAPQSNVYSPKQAPPPPPAAAASSSSGVPPPPPPPPPGTSTGHPAGAPPKKQAKNVPSTPSYGDLPMDITQSLPKSSEYSPPGNRAMSPQHVPPGYQQGNGRVPESLNLKQEHYHEQLHNQQAHQSHPAQQVHQPYPAQLAHQSPAQHAQQQMQRPSKVAPPLSAAENEMLTRRQFPVFNWATCARVSVAIPPKIAYTGGNAEVRVVDATAVVEFDNSAVKFPGPLVSKGGPIKSKKKELEKWMDEKIAKMHSSNEAQGAGDGTGTRLEHKLMLWKVLRVLLKSESLSKALVDHLAEIRQILVPGIADLNDGKDDPANFKSATDLYQNRAVRRGSTGSGHGEIKFSSSDMKSILFDLEVGNREGALRKALENRLWAHALVIAGSLGSDQWHNAVAEFVREDVRTLEPPASQSLALIYRVFSGSGADSGMFWLYLHSLKKALFYKFTNY